MGDGAFLMSAAEIETAVRERVPFVVLVWVDGGYGLIGWKQDIHFGRQAAVSFGNPDFVQLAESFGARGLSDRSGRRAAAHAPEGARRRRGLGHRVPRRLPRERPLDRTARRARPSPSDDPRAALPGLDGDGPVESRNRPERTPELPGRPDHVVLDKIANLGEGRKRKNLESISQLVLTYEPEFEDLTDAELLAKTDRVPPAGRERRVARRPAARGVRRGPRGVEALDRQAALRRAGHGRRRAAPGEHRRDEDR